MPSKRTLLAVAAVAAVLALLVVLGGRLLTAAAPDTVFDIATAPGKNGGQDMSVPTQQDVTNPGGWGNPICQSTSIPGVYNAGDKFVVWELDLYLAKSALTPPSAQVAVAIAAGGATAMAYVSASGFPMYAGYGSMARVAFPLPQTVFTAQSAGEQIRFCLAASDVGIYIGNGVQTTGVQVTGTLALDAMAGFASSQLYSGQVPPPPPPGQGMSATFSYTLRSDKLTMDYSISPSGGTGYYTCTVRNWGDGSGNTLIDGCTGSYKYAAAGTYQVTWSAKDSGAGFYQTSTSVAAPGTAPPPTTLALALTCSNALKSTCDGVASGGTPPYQFGFSAQQGSKVTSQLTGGNDYQVVWQYVAPGTYEFGMTVRDSGGQQASKTATVSVAKLAVDFASATNGLGASFSSTTSGGTPPVLSWRWSFGDGQELNGADTTAHVYGANGTYTVTLTVSDSMGATASASHDVTVTKRTQGCTSNCSNPPPPPPPPPPPGARAIPPFLVIFGVLSVAAALVTIKERRRLPLLIGGSAATAAFAVAAALVYIGVLVI